MTTPSTTTRCVFGLLAALLLVACSERKLVPVNAEAPQVVDDLVDVEANFCTRPVEDVTFPVKLLLVLDTSGSLQFTDQSGLRRVAVRRLMSQLSTENDLSVATFGFGSNINVYPDVAPGTPLFVPASQWSEPNFLQLADVQTNYFGSLAAVKSHILKDLLTSDPAEISRTKYVIIFFSDGSPSPRCCINSDETVGELGDLAYGCEPEPYEVDAANAPGAEDIRYCEGEPEIALCNAADFLERARNNNPGAAPPDYGDGVLEAFNELEANDNYNRSYQIEDLVTDIMDVGEEFGVGEMRLHTALLFDSTLPDTVKQIYRLNRCRSESLLRRMSELGNGVYRDFEGGEDIDFLSFNFTSLKQNFTMLRAYVQNDSALPPVVLGNIADAVQAIDFRPDTDGDGLDDAAELALGSDGAARDSDKLATPPQVTEVPTPIADRSAWGDGWSDRFEFDRLAVGFDPRYQSLPVDDCPFLDVDGADEGRDRQDIDGDGLTGCEEGLLGTDIRRADSDGDGFSDGVELRYGTDPAVNEGNRDADFDGVRNSDEMQRGNDPLLADGSLRDRTAARYQVTNTGTTSDGRSCYNVVARGVHLASTAPRFLGGRSGYNDVKFWIAEAPSEATSRVELRVACHRAQFRKPSLKDPANGVITFEESDFLDLANPIDIDRLRNEDTCKGLEIR
jgi:hypothetical protein